MKYTRLSDNELSSWLSKNPGWHAEDHKLQRTYTFADFATALAFTVRVGCIAERRDHHPDITVRWGACDISWSTHAVQGLSSLDLELAESTEAAFSDAPKSS